MWAVLQYPIAVPIVLSVLYCPLSIRLSHCTLRCGLGFSCCEYVRTTRGDSRHHTAVSRTSQNDPECVYDVSRLLLLLTCSALCRCCRAPPSSPSFLHERETARREAGRPSPSSSRPTTHLRLGAELSGSWAVLLSPRALVLCLLCSDLPVSLSPSHYS